MKHRILKLIPMKTSHPPLCKSKPALKSSFTRRILAAAALSTLIPAMASAQTYTYTLNSSDTGGNSSFNTDGNWTPTPGGNPSVGNSASTYFVGITSGLELRTPNSLDTFTFGGASLTLGDATRAGNLRIISSANIEALRIYQGQVVISSGTRTLSGNINLTGGVATFNGGAYSNNSTLIIASSISGTGSLRVVGNAETGTPAGKPTIRLTGANSSYSGGTTIVGATLGRQILLDVQSVGALGTGNVSVNQYAELTLGTGTTASSFIYDTATLSLASGIIAGGVNLNFTGFDTIGAISFDGGTTFGGVGTYGAIGSGATFQNAVFSGTGMLNVVPEPAHTALLGMLAVFGGIGYRTFKKRSPHQA